MRLGHAGQRLQSRHERRVAPTRRGERGRGASRGSRRGGGPSSVNDAVGLALARRAIFERDQRHRRVGDERRLESRARRRRESSSGASTTSSATVTNVARAALRPREVRRRSRERSLTRAPCARGPSRRCASRSAVFAAMSARLSWRLLALREAELDLHVTALEVEAQRDERVALARDRAIDLRDLRTRARAPCASDAARAETPSPARTARRTAASARARRARPWRRRRRSRPCRRASTSPRCRRARGRPRSCSSIA